MRAFIGVDIGTTGIRAGVYDEDFTLLGSGAGKSLIKRSLRNEIIQDPDEIYTETARAVHQAVNNAGIETSGIAALSFDGQMAGIMGIDAAWNACTPYDSWLDTRCSAQVEEIKQKAHRRVIEKTGNIPSYNHGPKILWWKQNEKDTFKKIHKFIQPSAYVVGRLCGLKAGDAFVDWTYLHFSGFADSRRLKWDETLTRLFEIPDEKLPAIVSPHTVVGYTDKEESERFGIPSGTPVAAGCGDTISCFLGTGAVQSGNAVDVAGTASVFAAATNRFTTDYDGMVYCCRSVIEDLWYTMSYINGGGLNLEWFKNTFAGGKSFDELDSDAAQLAPGSDGLLFIPHLEGRGYPNDPGMRGQWKGFTRSHTVSHFYRSILEGIAYEYALYKEKIQSLSGHETEFSVRVVAGGSRSDVWNRIKADVLNCRYCTINREDISILGQALIAATAVAHIDNPRDAVTKIIDIKEEYIPDPENPEQYAAFVGMYKRILENCTP